MNMTRSGGPWKGLFLLSLLRIQPLLSVTCLKTTFSPLFLVSDRPCHFSPKDGDSMFFWKVDIDLQNYVAPKSRTTSTSFVRMVDALYQYCVLWRWYVFFCDESFVLVVVWGKSIKEHSELRTNGTWCCDYNTHRTKL
jgi:hypothetical protein